MSLPFKDDPRHRRRTTGCLTCRRRRVRCDEVRPRCRQCTRMERTCDWQGDTNVNIAGRVGSGGRSGGCQEASASSSIISLAASLDISRAEVEGDHHLSMRPEPVRAAPRKLKICSNCRSDRVRCSRDRPSCFRCLHKKTVCRYPDHESTAISTSLSNNNSNPITNLDITTNLNSNTNVDLDAEHDHVRQDDPTENTRSSPGRFGNEDEGVEARVGDASRPRDSRGMDQDARVLAMLLKDDAYLARHVDAYFEHVHTTGCYGFLHEPSVREAMSNGTLPRALALAMSAASTRFLSSTTTTTTTTTTRPGACHTLSDPGSTGNEMAHRAQVWADEARRLVFSRLYEYDVDALASLLLLFYHAVANAQFEVVRILAPTAARMAVGMNLHIEEEEEEEEREIRGSRTVEREREAIEQSVRTEIRREKKRRIVWACQFFDWFTCQGRHENLALRPGSVAVRLPADESSFRAGRPSDMPDLETFDRDLVDDGAHGVIMNRHNPRSAYIHLMWIRTRVVQYVVGCPRASHSPWSADSRFYALERELSEWSRRLPASLIASRIVEPSRSTTEPPTLDMLLLMLEAWFHEACACLLGIVLPSAGLGGHLSVALPPAMIAEAPHHWLAHARQRCLDHCVAISEPARRGALASPSFVFEDVDFPLLAVESIERRMAWVDAEPVRAFDEEIMLPLAIHLEATFRSAAATRVYFPVVGPLLVAANQMLLHRGFPAMPAVERDLNPDQWYRQTISSVQFDKEIAGLP